MLKEQIEVLIRENALLKRAVTIQHERQKEHDDKSQEIQHLKQLVSQYQQQLRTLEAKMRITSSIYNWPSTLFLCADYYAICAGEQLRTEDAFAAGSARQLHSRALPSRCVLTEMEPRISTKQSMLAGHMLALL